MVAFEIDKNVFVCSESSIFTIELKDGNDKCFWVFTSNAVSTKIPNQDGGNSMGGPLSRRSKKFDSHTKARKDLLNMFKNAKVRVVEL